MCGLRPEGGSGVRVRRYGTPAMTLVLGQVYRRGMQCWPLDPEGQADTGKRDYRNLGSVVAVCEHRWCVFHIYRKAGMRQPSEPERAPLQEGMTPHTLSREDTMPWHGFVAHFRMEWVLIFHCLKER
jgi:hypothetical protein